MVGHHNPGSRLRAVLGPTNTGKTHLAVERMLGHRSGMIGLPLRLLAREIYDRVVASAGPRQVALITGEEKLIPPQPRYFVCTVEAMPLDRSVAFLAVDEIQLCADAERGHVFTHRLLHARGEDETMFLGADTMRPLIRRLVPGVEFVSRPRFSRLTYAGARKLTRLPPRSAIVAFSATDVYGLAEYLRRQRGGAAVVLGALSPRTRNAQVALYQAGEVDYMVATDAIGMGLNMDVNHIAFAALRKFDGRGERDLGAAELAQIAGRAGRHMNDGSFGTTGDVGGIDAEVVGAIENHRFAKLRAIHWRNPQLRFTSLKALVRSLEAPAPGPGLLRAADADDYLALRALARDDEIAGLATNPDTIRLLWEVCRIPDYRKVMADAHVRLLGRIYTHLMQGDGRLPADWVERLVAGLDRADGDIDTLATRIAHIRTWTYVSNRTGWLADPGHWQARTRAVEDRLSDALHERLTQRFIDRRTAVLVRRMKQDGEIAAVVADDGGVTVEGHFIGRLTGFRFVADSVRASYEGKALWNAAKRALNRVIAGRVEALASADDTAFSVDDGARVIWRGAAVARLVAGPRPLAPRIEVPASDLLSASQRQRLGRRLAAWLEDYLDSVAGPLRRACASDLGGPARGLVYQLGETLGTVPRGAVERQVRALGPQDRKALARLDVRLGSESVYIREMLKPRGLEARALLWAVHAKRRRVPAMPPGGRVSISVDDALPSSFYAAIGYRVFGGRALRVDILERIAVRARQLARLGPFAPGPEFLTLAGCRAEELDAVLVGLGYLRGAADGDGIVRFSPCRRTKKPRRRRDNSASPFAKLAELRFGA